MNKQTEKPTDGLKNKINLLKVHLTPKFFSPKNKSSCFGEYFFEKKFGFGQIIDFLCPIEVLKIVLKSPPFWLTTVFQKIKGLATTVTSLNSRTQTMNFCARKAYNWLNCLSVFSKWHHNSTLLRSLFTRSWSIQNSTSTGHKKLRIWPNPKIISKTYSPKHEDFF